MGQITDLSTAVAREGGPRFNRTPEVMDISGGEDDRDSSSSPRKPPRPILISSRPISPKRRSAASTSYLFQRSLYKQSFGKQHPTGPDQGERPAAPGVYEPARASASTALSRLCFQVVRDLCATIEGIFTTARSSSPKPATANTARRNIAPVRHADAVQKEPRGPDAARLLAFQPTAWPISSATRGRSSSRSTRRSPSI